MNKIIGYVLAVVIVAGSSYGAYRYSAPTPAPQPVPVNPAPAPVDGKSAFVVIKAPTTAKIGELVTISVEESNAENFSWRVVPATPNFRVDKDGRQAVLTSGDGAGEYLVIVAAAKDNTVDVKTHLIKFAGGSVAPSDLAGKVVDWAGKVSSPTKRDDMIKLGQSFLSVVAALEDGTVKPENIVDATRRSNRSALKDTLPSWEPFLVQLQEELKSLAKAGKLKDSKDHIETWKVIGNTLTNAAN